MSLVLSSRLLGIAGAASIFVAAGAGAQTQPAGGRSPTCPELLPPADPSTEIEFGCYYFGSYTWNDGSGAGNVSGRIYWPSNCSSSTPPGSHPLVLLMHGDGHAYTDYGYLMSHLARNGFIAATISSFGTNAERAAQALTYLGFVRNHWAHKTHVQNSIGLIGHSRGGEAVLTLARQIEALGLSHDVDAIISLAPTDNDEGGGGLHESVDGGESEAYLVIYGTHDSDVRGHCIAGTALGCGQDLVAPQRTGFALFDRAGIEGGTEPFPQYDDVVTRCMLFVEQANHNSWRSTCAGFPTFPELTCDEHQDIARGYMNAFLRWRLLGQTIYRDFFTGRWMPDAVAAAGVEINTQYVEGYGRRAVDDFQNAAFATNSLGGTVTLGGVMQVLYSGSLWAYDSTIPHDTRAAVLGWTPPGLAPNIRWSIPNAQTTQGARFRDVENFECLSFRAGQVYGSSLNTPGQSKDFWVYLTDAFGHSTNWVRVAWFTDLAYPEPADLTTPFDDSATTVSSAMETVRIPLCRFAGIDLRNVISITFQMTVPGSGSGEILVDNVEFTD